MAKRKTNWETLNRPFPTNRRANLYVNQGHAFDHWFRRCGNDTGKIPNPPVHRDMVCPICGFIKGFNKFTEDHCPQEGGQSNFGGPSCIVLVCKGCNGIPGKSYEGRSAQVRRGERAPNNKIVHGSFDQDGQFTPSGVADSSQMATDQKTAFLVSFAVLGHRFAISPMYDHVRQSIYEGSTPPGGPIAPDDLCELQDESVYEHDNGVIYVLGRGYGWMLGPKGVRASTQTQGQRRWDWPETHSRGARQDFDAHLAAGGPFHADFCTNPEHHNWSQATPAHAGVIPAEPAN